jgi:von Willebrand factor type A domain
VVLAAACALQSPGVAAADGARLDILTVETSADRQATVLADVRPVGETPIRSEAFTLTAGGMRLPTRVEPVLGDQLAVGLVVDGSGQGAARLHSGVSGPASFLLQLPLAARVAVVADTSPPALIAPLSVGAKDALSGLDALRPHGERDTSQALTLALRQLPAGSGEPRLLLLFTGAADAGGEPATALAQRLAQAHTLLAVVSTAADNAYWSRVTAATGGVLVPAHAAELLGAFERLLDPLRARYLLTFPAPQVLPARVSIQVSTAAGTTSADAFVLTLPASHAQAGADTGTGRLPVPALIAALVILVLAGTVLRARSRSADHPPAADASRRSPAAPPSTPVRRSTPPPSATPATEAAGTSALRGGVPAATHPTAAAPPVHVAPAAADRGPGTPAQQVSAPAAAASSPAAAPARLASAIPDRARHASSGPPPAATAAPPPAALPTRVARAVDEKEVAPAPAAAGDGGDPDLDAQVGAAAAAVDSGRLDRARAVAQLALAAPGRVDLLDRIIERCQAAGTQRGRPPADTALDLTESARQVIMGEATLIGPDGARVEQTVPAGAERITRTLLRLTRNGRWECDCRTAGELAQYIDISTLVAAPSVVLRSGDSEQ